MREPHPGAPRIIADVAGRCARNPGDFLALETRDGRAAAKNLLAVMTAGAYGAVQAGTYITRALVRKCLFGKMNGR